MIQPRILIDTNVLISAIIFGGAPGELLDAARAGRVHGVVSLHILGEFRDVLTRPRFGFDAATVDSLIEEIAALCEVVPVEHAVRSWTVDPKDDPVVEAAMAARVQMVVTGDQHLLNLSLAAFQTLSPAEALARL